MFGNSSTDDFEDEDVIDTSGYKPPQSFDTPVALPTIAQPHQPQPDSYPFAAPAQQTTWQPLQTLTAATSAPAPATIAATQPFTQTFAQSATFNQPVASTGPQSISGAARRIPAAWGGAAPTLAAASAALPVRPTAPPVAKPVAPAGGKNIFATAAAAAAQPLANIFASSSAQPAAQPDDMFAGATIAQQPAPFIPVAAAYSHSSVPAAHSALPTVHVSHPVKLDSVALPTPITSAVNVSEYKGPSAFSNAESYFDDED